jgi:phosphoglycerol transferase MdoB-like AlkP superfamily enzyme
MAGLLPINIDANPAIRLLPKATEASEGLDALVSGEFRKTVEWFRNSRFFSLLPFLGLFLIAPVAMLARRGRPREDEADWRFALLCFAFAGIACLAWGLLLFGTIAARTALPLGSLAVPLLALCGCVAGLSATFPRLAFWLVALNSLVVLAAYTPSLTPLPETSYSPIAAAIAAASLFLLGLILFRQARPNALVPWPTSPVAEVPAPGSRPD